MKYVPKSVTRAVGRTVLKTKMNGPTLLFGAGVVGVVSATVLACRATLKVEDILTEHNKEMLEVERTARFQNVDEEQERRAVSLHTMGKLAKLYAVPTVVGIVSIGCLTKSHKMMLDRNTQLTAAYVAMQKFLESYRSRVREEIGEEREKVVYYASTPVELVEDTPNGPKKIFGSTPTQRSPYAAIFDERNHNWQESAEFNIAYLRIQEQQLTDKLRTQGHLFLNEVYDRLGMPRTPTGQICGWAFNSPHSDEFVEFFIQPMHDFQGTLLVDFNVAGEITSLAFGHGSE